MLIDDAARYKRFHSSLFAANYTIGFSRKIKYPFGQTAIWAKLLHGES
jgi:hypothetical protein